MLVGFAGLGRMGAHMARNLAGAGHQMVLWNRSRDKAEALAEEIGATVVNAPAGLTERCAVVLTMLSDDAASEQVHLGPEGLFRSEGATRFVEMGTMSPAHIRTLAQAAPAHSRVVDAPVSGATQAAEAAQLLIMAGCRAEDAQTLLPLFDVIGNRTIFLGSTGAGSVMKLAVNAMLHGINQGFAEAFVLAEAAGIAPVDAFDVIEASAACAPMLKYRRPLYLDEAGQGVTFTVALARKDMEVATALAAELGVVLPQGRVTLDQLSRAEASGFASRDMAAMLAFMRKDHQ